MFHHCFVLIPLLALFSDDINPSSATICFLFRTPNESKGDVELKGKKDVPAMHCSSYLKACNAATSIHGNLSGQLPNPE